MPKYRKNGKIAPVKFDKFFDAFEELLNENSVIETTEGGKQIPNNKAVIYTDAELVFLTNERLGKKDRIDQTTFEKWKQSFEKGELEQRIEERFFGVYKRALMICKENLFNSLVVGGHFWQRFAWIMERKFSETWGKSEERNKDDENEAQRQNQITIKKTYLKEKND